MFRFRRCSLNLTRTLHLRFFSQPAIAPLIEEPPVTYLEGFPQPDPVGPILAIPRSSSGRLAAAKERKAQRVPSIVFEAEDGQHGGNKRLISVQANQIRNLVAKLGRSFFLSRLFDLEIRPEFEADEIIEKVRVLPRQVLSYLLILMLVVRVILEFLFLGLKS